MNNYTQYLTVLSCFGALCAIFIISTLHTVIARITKLDTYLTISPVFGAFVIISALHIYRHCKFCGPCTWFFFQMTNVRALCAHRLGYTFSTVLPCFRGALRQFRGRQLKTCISNILYSASISTLDVLKKRCCIIGHMLPAILSCTHCIAITWSRTP